MNSYREIINHNCGFLCVISFSCMCVQLICEVGRSQWCSHCCSIHPNYTYETIINKKA